MNIDLTDTITHIFFVFLPNFNIEPQPLLGRS